MYTTQQKTTLELKPQNKHDEWLLELMATRNFLFAMNWTLTNGSTLKVQIEANERVQRVFSEEPDLPAAEEPAKSLEDLVGEMLGYWVDLEQKKNEDGSHGITVPYGELGDMFIDTIDDMRQLLGWNPRTTERTEWNFDPTQAPTTENLIIWSWAGDEMSLACAPGTREKLVDNMYWLSRGLILSDENIFCWKRFPTTPPKRA